MYADSSASVLFASPSAATHESDAWLARRYQQGDPGAIIALIRTHQRAIFHLTHGLLRDEVAAEKITQRVFSRARRQLDAGQPSASVTTRLYYASLRFCRMYYWKSSGPAARRRMAAAFAGCESGLGLHVLVQVIARQPDKIDPRDCELLALRHVLGLPLGSIAQLLRMHPYEISNRLTWARERVARLGGRSSAFAAEHASAFALSA